MLQSPNCFITLYSLEMVHYVGPVNKDRHYQYYF